MPEIIFTISEQEYISLTDKIDTLTAEIARLKQVSQVMVSQAEAEEITGMGYAALKTERERPGTVLKYTKGASVNSPVRYDKLSLLEFNEQRHIKPLPELKLTA